MVGLINKSTENIVIKGENAGCQHFLLLSQYFQVFFHRRQTYVDKGLIMINFRS